MAEPRLSVVEHPCFREHEAPRSHPERPERLEAIHGALAPLRGTFREVQPREATDDEILRIHSPEHLQLLRSLEGRHSELDPDTYAAPRSFEIARLAAGSAVDLARRVARGETTSGFGLVRPPGHHAERDRAMGFCLLNSVAIAAASLRADEGLERIAIVDWDVHHGNGTQHTFEADRDTLFVSLHQFPFYPGTGALGEMGRGAGEGSTVNLPFPAGTGDGGYGAAFDELVVPVLQEFRPEILLVSAGFDAHARDPLANMRLSTQGFAGLAARLRQVGEEVCQGRIVLTLEGGYDLQGLGESVREVARVLAAPEVGDHPLPPPGREERAVVDQVREGHTRHWRLRA